MAEIVTDYSRYLVLYSAGADSTFFIDREPTAKHLIHYAGLNESQASLALVNANLLDRFLTIVSPNRIVGRDGETNQIHALYDTLMAIDAGITALSFGMLGIVMCFNAEDIGIDVEAVTSIFKRAEPAFQLLTPLRGMSAASIREALAAKPSPLKYISCMYGDSCGFCAKCKRGR
jgi:hypothetical protein